MARIALVVRAGRPNHWRVVDDLAESVRRHNHLVQHDLTLYVSLDETCVEASPLRSSHGAKREQYPFQRIQLIRNSDRHFLVESAVSAGVTSSLESALLFRRRPYAFQLNAAIAFAIREGNDYAIFFDDDQGFAVPVPEPEGSLVWQYMDVIGDHVRALENGASVSTGPIAGCLSPIPENLIDLVGAHVVRDLGLLFSGAHEFLSEDRFAGSGYAPLRLAQSPSVPVALNSPLATSWVTPANMGINLRRGFPPFFNPPFARGEDAFFALGLQAEERIAQVDAGVFHDPFLRYPGIYTGQFPPKFGALRASGLEVTRFAHACVGWLRYMPLFLRVTQQSTASRCDILVRKYALAAQLAERLAASFNEDAFLLMPRALQYHIARTERDHDHWQLSTRAWRQNVLPWLMAQRQVS